MSTISFTPDKLAMTSACPWDRPGGDDVQASADAIGLADRQQLQSPSSCGQIAAPYGDLQPLSNDENNIPNDFSTSGTGSSLPIQKCFSLRDPLPLVIRNCHIIS